MLCEYIGPQGGGMHKLISQIKLQSMKSQQLVGLFLFLFLSTEIKILHHLHGEEKECYNRDGKHMNTICLTDNNSKRHPIPDHFTEQTNIGRFMASLLIFNSTNLRISSQ